MITTKPIYPRILIFSQRNIFGKALFRCPLYEFENVISQIDSVELLAPTADPCTVRNRTAKLLGYHAPIFLSPKIQSTRPNLTYDVFFAVCGAPTDLLMVNAVPDLRHACKISVCLMDELWVKQMKVHSHFLNILKGFDVVMLYYSQTVATLGQQIGRRCVFLPPGVDTILFCPYPNPRQRTVDVCSIGRRSEITHRSLLKMVDEDGIFYIHDTLRGDQAIDWQEHRKFIANLGKRSRYFIVNPGLIDRPDIRGDQIEIGNRYFEAAACGSILLGELPTNGKFEILFDYPDALIQLPYNSSEIASVIHELDEKPERQAIIRRTNVVQALRHHDWVYRWEAILKTIGLEPMPELRQRKERLRTMAEAIEQHGEGVRIPDMPENANEQVPRSALV